MLLPLSSGYLITFGAYHQHIPMQVHQPFVHIDIVFCGRMAQIYQLDTPHRFSRLVQIGINKFCPFVFFCLADLGKTIAGQIDKIKSVVVDAIKNQGRVLPGLLLVRARLLRLTNLLISDDLPTLLRPASAISGRWSAGYCFGPTALMTNSAFFIT